ncbi:TetR/AcrR family transcriptional regulator [Streptomyces sp. L7]
MYTDRYRTRLCWSHDGVGEGPPGRAPREGRAGTHPRRVTKLFRTQGINRTGMDQLCAEAQVSKRTAYQHFAGKDDLIAEYLRRFDPEVMAGVFDRTDLTPRERLLAAFELPASGSDELTPLCPYIEAAVEIHDPGHPASQYARDYKLALAARLAATAREAGATNPEQLGEQLALLPRRRLGPHPGPQRRVLPHRRRHRRRPHRQRPPREGPRPGKRRLGAREDRPVSFVPTGSGAGPEVAAGVGC